MTTFRFAPLLLALVWSSAVAAQTDFTARREGGCAGHVVGIPAVDGIGVRVSATRLDAGGVGGSATPLRGEGAGASAMPLRGDRVGASATPLRGEEGAVVSGRCDAEGRYRLEGLTPGRYRIVAWLSAAAYRPFRMLRDLPVAGVLGSGELGSSAVTVTIAPGATTTCDLRLPAVGRVTGRVMARGEPVAGVRVFATAAPLAWNELDDDRLPNDPAVAVTAGDGSFTFHVLQPGRWHVYLRRLGTAITSGPFPLTVDAPAAVVVRDLALGDARITGIVDPAWLQTWGSRTPTALLFRAERVSNDAFALAFFGEGDSIRDSMTPRPLAEDGSFAFEAVPAGRYLLRFADGNEQRDLQVPVVVEPGEDLDLGVLHAPAILPIDVPVTLPPNRVAPMVAIRAVFDALPQPAWVGVATLPAPRLQCRLPAGTYRIELLDASSTTWRPGEGSGTSAILHVRDDGSCVPHLVSF